MISPRIGVIGVKLVKVGYEEKEKGGNWMNAIKTQREIILYMYALKMKTVTTNAIQIGSIQPNRITLFTTNTEIFTYPSSSFSYFIE